MLKIFEDKKNNPLIIEEKGLQQFFWYLTFFLEQLALWSVIEGVGALFGLIGIGTMIAGHLYPNTDKELSNAVEDFENKWFWEKS